MDRFDPEREARLAAVADLLRRERPAPTLDELERVARRLDRSRAPRWPPLPFARLVVTVCLAFGLLFMTAGTGLAIGEFVPPEAADHVQYPYRTLTVEVSIRQAETRSDLPFTGVDAIPILVGGIALVATGAAVNRRTGGTRLPV